MCLVGWHIRLFPESNSDRDYGFLHQCSFVRAPVVWMCGNKVSLREIPNKMNEMTVSIHMKFRVHRIQITVIMKKKNVNNKILFAKRVATVANASRISHTPPESSIYFPITVVLTSVAYFVPVRLVKMAAHKISHFMINCRQRSLANYWQPQRCHRNRCRFEFKSNNGTWDRILSAWQVWVWPGLAHSLRTR